MCRLLILLPWKQLLTGLEAIVKIEAGDVV